MLSPKNCWIQIQSSVQKIFGIKSKKFGPQKKFWVSKNIGSKEIQGQKQSSVRNLFGYNQILCPKDFWAINNWI